MYKKNIKRQKKKLTKNYQHPAHYFVLTEFIKKKFKGRLSPCMTLNQTNNLKDRNRTLKQI